METRGVDRTGGAGCRAEVAGKSEESESEERCDGGAATTATGGATGERATGGPADDTSVESTDGHEAGPSQETHIILLGDDCHLSSFDSGKHQHQSSRRNIINIIIRFFFR